MSLRKLSGLVLAGVLSHGAAFGQGPERPRFGPAGPAEEIHAPRTLPAEAPRATFGKVTTADPAPAAAPAVPAAQASGSCAACGPAADAGPPPGQYWFGAEYLLWQVRGQSVPPLVTAAPAGVPRPVAGTLGDPNTRVLYRGRLDDDWRSGVRLGGGAWLDDGRAYAVQAGGFWVAPGRTTFAAASDGGTGLFRPFAGPTGRADTELVAFADPGLAPGALTPVLAGRVAVSSETTFGGWDVALRGPLPNPGEPGPRADFIVGYRGLRLRDSLGIREDLVTTNPNPAPPIPPAGTRFVVVDQFRTTNTFHGADFGLATDYRVGRLRVGVLGKLALGSTRREVTIDGATQVTPPGGAPTALAGGLLAQPTNSGRYTRHRFDAVPEVGFNVGFQVSPNVQVFGGYTALYWGDVARAGEQIDLRLNQVPPTAPAGPGGRPAFPDNTADFLAHGLNVGLAVNY